MAIKGSFANDDSLNSLKIEAMCRATTADSLDKLESRVKTKTPVKTGELRDSIHQGEVTKPRPNHYKGTVESSLEYAAPIEYGAAPHEISPNSKEALAFDGEVREHVMHPGNEPHHMFHRGGSEFEQLDAERIARANAEKFLM